MTAVADTPVAKKAVPRGSVIARREELIAAAGPCAAIVASRSFRPVLACVKIDARNREMTIESRGKNFEAVFIRLAAVQIEHEFTAFVNAQKFLAVVNASRGETLNISVSESGMSIVGEASKFTLPIVEDGDLPLFEAADKSHATIKGVDLLKLLRQTKHSVGDNPTRYALTGVLFSVDGSKATAHSTESHVLSESIAACESTEKKSAIVSGNELNQIIPRLFGPDDQIEVSYGAAQVVFRGEIAIAAIPITEGVFPDIADAAPRDCPMLFKSGTADMMDAVSRSLVIRELDDGLVLTFAKKTGLTIDTKSSAGESSVILPAKFEGADSLVIGVDGDYLANALKAADTDEIEIHLTAPNRPMLLVAGKNYRVVIMPKALR